MRSSEVLLLLIIGRVGCSLDFPPNFRFGAATAAYQVEGGWNVGGRTPSVWDEYVHKKPEAIEDHSTGDVACDSYHQWRRDVEMAADLGLDFYRFSISWTRLFPNGFTNYVNEDGKRYYDNLIDTLLEIGIEPVVTLYHWDLPQVLQDLGGWTNPLMSDWFAVYAGAVYSLYADRVTTWITMNEPVVICDGVYQIGVFAPAIISTRVGNYMCAKNVMIAHAKAWRIYDRQYRPKYKGKVGIANHHFWYEPADQASGEAAERARQLMAGIYSYPIYSAKGGWPPIIEEAIANRSAQEGFTVSRLPAFTQEEIELVRGTYDYYGINYYTSRLAREGKKGERLGGAWPFDGSPDINVAVSVDPRWNVSRAMWLYVYPEGLRRQLKWIKEEFGDVEVLITENGYADMKPQLHDPERVRYFRDHLQQVLLSIYEDGVRVVGYIAWSLMDNFEWNSGYQTKFGLYSVDFSSPLRERSPRTSARYYAGVIQHHSLNFTFSRQLSVYEHRSTTVTISIAFSIFISSLLNHFLNHGFSFNCGHY